MERIAIFVFYDSKGIVDNYKLYLLESLKSVVRKIIIVINGEIKKEDTRRMEKFSSDIYYRDNSGYDGGAYKDVFNNILHKEELINYDEIILMNDTFYGPFIDWKYVFQRMGTIECDFWGLTRHYGGGRVLGIGDSVECHIQAYFCVCRKPVFENSCFWKFWERMDYPNSYQKAIEDFEIAFSTYLTLHGFSNGAYSDFLYGADNPKLRGEVIYVSRAYELIKKIDFPILKRKALSFSEVKKCKTILEYIAQNTDYDIDLICQKLRRQCEEKEITPFNPLDIDRFYRQHDRVFIYGAGNYGRSIAEYFEIKGWNYNGFIVTKINLDDEKNVFSINDVHLRSGDGIICAVSEKYIAEVYSILKDKLLCSQILMPQYRKND
jgi:rhamnosyltransferase